MAAPKLLDEWISSAADNASNISVGGYTSIVSHAKFILGAAVLILLASLVLWPLLYPVDQPLKLTFNAVDQEEAEPKQMVRPRFYGIDEEDRPYTIRAKLATEHSEERVELSKMTADMAMKDESWLMLEAEKGEVNPKTRKAVLNKGVRIFSSDGYEINTPSASVDLNASTASGKQKVKMQGPLGVLRGTGFFLDTQTQKLNIKGRVHLRLYPRSRQR